MRSLATLRPPHKPQFFGDFQASPQATGLWAAVQKMEAQELEEMVGVTWNRPNGVYHGVVQYISSSLVKEVDKEGNVKIHWPRKGNKSEIWKGQLAAGSKAHPLTPQADTPKGEFSTGFCRIFATGMIATSLK